MDLSKIWQIETPILDGHIDNLWTYTKPVHSFQVRVEFWHVKPNLGLKIFMPGLVVHACEWLWVVYASTSYIHSWVHGVAFPTPIIVHS